MPGFLMKDVPPGGPTPGGSLKAVVVDDDEPTCNLLISLLETFEGLTVAGKAATGTQMLDLVREVNPDVVFIDVQMPDLDGLSAVYRLQKEHPGIFVVFVSGYSRYAVEAFNLNAGDYLVKPVDRERLARALAKARQFKALRPAAKEMIMAPPSVPVSEVTKETNGYDKLILKNGHNIVSIDAETIFFVEGAGKKCIFHTVCGRYEISERLSAIEKKLDPDRFFRCHKSYIINVERIEKVAPYADRAYEVSFHGYPHKAAMRREKFKEFCRMINVK
ncbi:MAG: LytTR family DNA-binding domain-containing protein [Bacillota bacterium]